MYFVLLHTVRTGEMENSRRKQHKLGDFRVYGIGKSELHRFTDHSTLDHSSLIFVL
jgi:hypothetical protein